MDNDKISQNSESEDGTISPVEEKTPVVLETKPKPSNKFSTLYVLNLILVFVILSTLAIDGLTGGDSVDLFNPSWLGVILFYYVPLMIIVDVIWVILILWKKLKRRIRS